MTAHEKDHCAIAKRYAEQVVSGKIPACRWVQLACQRQLDDLRRKEWKWKFDKKKAARICKFAELLPHVKGKWPTKNIVLEPWQCFLLTTIFGWVDADGLRRFRKGLVVIPRKNAKSVLAAIVGLFLLALDGEPGAEVYSAATTRDQAKIVWGEFARKMLLRTPELAAEFGIEALAHSITVESTGSFFKPLSRDSDSLEGLNVHGAIIDELHAHGTREVFDVLDEATGARRQPLMFIISTEGDNPEGVFAEQVEYGQQILQGNHSNDAYFSIIYTIDPEDDWTAESSWRKANPNYGVSIFPEDLRTRCKEAIANSQSQASFLCKRLNVRVGASGAYFNIFAWDTICKDTTLKIQDFIGRPCFIVLDLASKRDLTAKMTIFRRGDGYVVFGHYYLPSEALLPGKPNYDFYRGWEEDGHLTITEGDRTDYSLIERDILEDVAIFKPIGVGVDPNYNAAHLTDRLRDEGVPMVDVPQKPAFLNEPMRELDAMIVSGLVKHNGDPVLSWGISNVVARVNSIGQIYPMKTRDENKIDPAQATIGGIGLWDRQPHPVVSVYDKGVGL